MAITIMLENAMISSESQNNQGTSYLYNFIDLFLLSVDIVCILSLHCTALIL